LAYKEPIILGYMPKSLNMPCLSSKLFSYFGLIFSSLLGSMAYPSDAMSQSFYSDIDPILPSDSFSFEPSELTESQTTELTSLPPPLPPSIQRIGDRTKQWALWTEMTKTEFIKWWLTTQYATKPEAKRVHWDRKRLSSSVWPYFDQVANIQTGQPKVRCKQCGLLFGHPSTHGTNTLKRHYEQGRCQKNQGKQINIQQSIQNMVCLLEREK
jgi:hypothetical protein